MFCAPVASSPAAATLEAVEAVANPDGELGLDALDGLDVARRQEPAATDRDRDGEPRFGMLETIREFAGSSGSPNRARSPPSADATPSIGSARASGCPRCRRPSRPVAIRQLEHELDNFRSALGWVIRSGEVELGLRLGAALRYFWRIGGHIREGLGWLEQVLASARSRRIDPPARPSADGRSGPVVVDGRRRGAGPPDARPGGGRHVSRTARRRAAPPTRSPSWASR